MDERFTVLQQSGSDLYTNHKCAGETLTTLMMKSLAARLAHDFTWRWTPEQKTDFSITDLPPTPADGVQIEVLQPRTSASPLAAAAPTTASTTMGGEPLPIGLMSAGGFSTRTGGRCPMGYDAASEGMMNQPHAAKEDGECPFAKAQQMPAASADGYAAGVCPMGYHQDSAAAPTGADLL